MDNVIGILGLDKDRAVYYRKSRSLLSPENQQNGTQLKSFEKYGICSWKMPKNIASLKTLTMHELSEPDDKTIKKLQQKLWLYIRMNFSNYADNVIGTENVREDETYFLQR